MTTTDEDYQSFFREADKDNDGYLSYTELLSMMRKHDYKGTDQQIMVTNNICFSNKHNINFANNYFKKKPKIGE